jgi:hypothetical protein
MQLLRYLSVASLLITTGSASGATPKEIDAAIQLGAGYLKDQYKGTTQKQLTGGTHGIGGSALAGLALLECGTAHSDPSVKAITAAVRDSSYTATQTYQIALCLLYLDKLGDPADVPLIQLLGVRLLVGQNGNGGWTYECIDSISALEEGGLRSSLLAGSEPTTANKPSSGTGVGKNLPPTTGKSGNAGKLLPEIEKYRERVAATRKGGRIDDNSNTQFGVLGLWAARKHGVPVDAALDLVEKRFLNSQTSSGGWPYVGSTTPGTPSMTCAGLLGLATAAGRREESRTQTPPKSGPSDTTKPPAKGSSDTKITPARQSDACAAAIEKGLASLGTVLVGNLPKKGQAKGPSMLVPGSTLGDRDLYFMWSVERVGVLYGLDKIGGVDWYDVGAEELVAAQNLVGSWGRGGRGAEVDTAFALLFLVKSNPALDLTNRLQRGGTITGELRTGPNTTGDNRTPATGGKPAGFEGASESRHPGVIVIRPGTPNANDPKKLADELAGARGLEWETLLKKAREAKGTEYTQALLLAIPRLDGDRLMNARETLVERLTQASAETLRTMAKSDSAEQRCAAVSAMSMKKDKAYIPDLIAALLDAEDAVVNSARAGLKSLTGQDFGPSAGATSNDRKAVVAAWREWLQQQKK